MKAMMFLGGVAGFLAASACACAQVAPAPVAAQEQRAAVDLNTAEIPQLEALPEIGTDLANAVVAGRPYKSFEHAAQVLKLSPEKTAALRPKVMVSPPPPVAAAAPQTAPSPDPRNNAPSQPPQTNDGKAISGKDVAERYDRERAKAAAGKSDK